MAEHAPAQNTAPPPLIRIIEGMLFLGGEPLSPARACGIIRSLTEAQFAEAVATLEHDYRIQGRPYGVQKQEGGYILALRPRFRGVLEKLYGGPRAARLSPAILDVLALVAYRQPATKQELDTLRGSECGSLLRQLVRRGLVAVVPHTEAGSKEVAYGTTPRFLELFKLRSLDDLPQTQDLNRL